MSIYALFMLFVALVCVLGFVEDALAALLNRWGRR